MSPSSFDPSQEGSAPREREEVATRRSQESSGELSQPPCSPITADCRELFTATTASSKSCSENSEGFTVLHSALQDLKSTGYYKCGIRILRRIAEEGSVPSEILLSVTDGLISVYRPDLEEHQNVRLENVLLGDHRWGESSTVSIAERSRLFSLLVKSSEFTSNKHISIQLGLVEKGLSILGSSGLSGIQREGFLETIATLASTNGSFLDVHAVRRAFNDISCPEEAYALARLLTIGITVGDNPKALARAAVIAVRIAILHPVITSAMVTAVEDQARANRSVVAVLSSFCNIYHSFGTLQERYREMSNYEKLLNALRPFNPPLHAIYPEHLGDFLVSNHDTYPALLATHLTEVDRLLQLPRERLSLLPTAVLQQIAATPANPGMISVFIKTLTQDVGNRTDLIEQALQDLSDLLPGAHHLTVTQWDDLDRILSAQIAKQRRVEGVTYSVGEILSECRHSAEQDIAWSNYVSLVEHLQDKIPNIAFITRGVLNYYLEAPTEERLAYLSDVMNSLGSIITLHKAEAQKFRAWIERLLAVDGPGKCLVKAYRSDTEHGFNSELLFSNYPVLDRSLSPEGIALFDRMLEYQYHLGLPTGTVTNNLASLALYAKKHPDQEETWSCASKLVSKLSCTGVPMDFLSVGHVCEFMKAPEDVTVLEKIRSHIFEIKRLALSCRGRPEESAVLKILVSIALPGPYSPGLPVLSRLRRAADRAHETVSWCRLTQLFGGEKSISPEVWTAVGRHLDAYRERGDSVETLISSVLRIDDELRKERGDIREGWLAAMEVMSALSDASSIDGKVGLPFDLLSFVFLARYHEADEGNRELLNHFVSGVTRFMVKVQGKASGESADQRRSSNADTLRGVLKEVTGKGFGLTDNEAMVHKLKLILSHDSVKSLSDFHHVLRELKLHALTDIMRNSSDDERRKWASGLMGKTFNMGGAPYDHKSAEERQHFSDTMEVVDRAFVTNKGFGGMALDCRGLPRCTKLDSVPPMIARYGLDSANRTFIVNCSSNERFPGKGFLLEGLQAEKLFVVDPRWLENGKRSPHWKWVTGKGLFAGPYFYNFDMEEFAACSFLMVRGVRVVVPPPIDRFMIHSVHYAYLVYNRHFAPFPEVALGVPVVVLQELLGSSMIQAADYRGFDPKRTDLSKVDLSPKALRQACKRRGLNLLDLTYGSVIGGGLCNAPAPQSKPDYYWEPTPDRSSIYQDSWGHTHKSWLGGRHFPGMGETLHQRLSFARNLQASIFNCFRGCQDYAAAFGFGLAFYKMGSTLVDEADFRETPDRTQDETGQIRDDSKNEAATVHKYRYRMLEETYRWYLGAREQKYRFELFPELHFAWVLDPNSLPKQSQRRFSIDLARMVLTTKEGTFQLPKDGDGTGDEEREIWRKHVVPHFESNSTGWDPRFYLRDGAFKIHE
jgi:hypothetical protein